MLTEGAPGKDFSEDEQATSTVECDWGLCGVNSTEQESSQSVSHHHTNPRAGAPRRTLHSRALVAIPHSTHTSRTIMHHEHQLAE
jgi:hypothetical protein